MRDTGHDALKTMAQPFYDPTSLLPHLCEIAIWANRTGFAVTETVEHVTGSKPAPIDGAFVQATT